MLTEKMSATAIALRRRFRYTRDTKRLDHWKIHKDGGPVHGDCEDFALTLLYDLSDRSMWKFWWNLLTFRAAIWQVTAFNGEGHAVLWYRGYWADNMIPDWYRTKAMRHKRLFPWLPPFLLVKFLVAAIQR